jgi:hypothetical protein
VGVSGPRPADWLLFAVHLYKHCAASAALRGPLSCALPVRTGDSDNRLVKKHIHVPAPGRLHLRKTLA